MQMSASTLLHSGATPWRRNSSAMTKPGASRGKKILFGRAEPHTTGSLLELENYSALPADHLVDARQLVEAVLNSSGCAKEDEILPITITPQQEV